MPVSASRFAALVPRRAVPAGTPAAAAPAGARAGAVPHAVRPLGDRIARVAAELFYRDGIHAVGVDRIASEAGVTKRTLYRYFATKDVLVAEALRRTKLIRFPREGEPVDRVAGAFDAMIAFHQERKLRGCPLSIASAELPDPRHPGRIVIDAMTSVRRAWFVERAREAGAADPELLGEQVEVLFDGAMTSSVKRGDVVPAVAARAAAITLFGTAAPASDSYERGAIQTSKPRTA